MAWLSHAAGSTVEASIASRSCTAIEAARAIQIKHRSHPNNCSAVSTPIGEGHETEVKPLLQRGFSKAALAETGWVHDLSRSRSRQEGSTDVRWHPGRSNRLSIWSSRMALLVNKHPVQCRLASLTISGCQPAYLALPRSSWLNASAAGPKMKKTNTSASHCRLASDCISKRFLAPVNGARKCPNLIKSH